MFNKVLLGITVTVIGVVIGSCTSSSTSVSPSSRPSSGITAEYAIVKTWFVTDRNTVPNANPGEAFGNDRSWVNYGVCEIGISREHRMGELESPELWRFEWREDSAKQVTVLETKILEKARFFNAMSEHLTGKEHSKALLFVHGYNVSFADAARRTAQMAYDLNFTGTPIFYSWPSQGNPLSYMQDEQNVEWAETNLKRFLTDFFTESDAEQIYLVGHSMGNRAMTRAIVALLAERPDFKERITEIILAAPDIDAEVFKRDILPALASAGRPITLYASSDDLSLVASKTVSEKPRAGDSGAHLILAPGVETIDAKGVNTDIPGQSHLAENRSVLSDMYYLIQKDQRADERFGLRRVETNKGPYWVFQQ